MKLYDGFPLVATAPDGIVRLRELILSLAVQGKLVPQDPSDEPADVLLKKIRTEKDRLIAEGKIRRDKPLPEITHEEKPFDLPEKWRWIRLGIAIELISGQHLGPSEYVDGLGSDIPYLTGPAEFGPCSPEPTRSTVVRRAVAVSGDILITVKGSGVGKLNTVSQAEIAISRQLMAIRPILLNAHFVQLVLRAMGAVFQQKAVGIAIPGIGREDVTEAVIGLPPIAEQARIVAKVDELMHLCDELDVRGRLEAKQHARLTATLFDALAASESPHALAENWARVAAHFDLLLDRPEAVDALEQTILQLAVRGLLVPQESNDEPASELLEKIRQEKDRLIADGKIKRDRPVAPIADDEKPFVLPNGWEWVRLADIATQITDGAHHTPEYTTHGVPFLSVKDISAGRLDFSNTRFVSEETHSDLSKRCNPELGDVLLTKIGTTGVAVVVDDDRPFSLFVSVALIKLPTTMIDSNFLALLVNSPNVRQQSADGTEGVGNKNLVLRKINSFLLPLPPLDEQRRIVERADELLHICTDLRERLSACQSCQTRLADALVEQTALFRPAGDAEEMAAAA